jgi:serine/threonine protein kinase
MPITTFQNIRGANVKAAVDQMASQIVSGSDARSQLTEIQTRLSAADARSGVLRIRSGKNKNDASLDVVGATRWGRWSAATSKERLHTARAMHDLLKNAGATQAVLAEFEAYRAGRGSKGIETAVMLRYLDRALGTGASDHALAALHTKLDLQKQGEGLIGSGAQGSVQRAQFKGEAMVLKTFSEPTALRTAPGGGLSRAQEGAAATYAKAVPGLLVPRLYIVKTEQQAENLHFDEQAYLRRRFGSMDSDDLDLLPARPSEVSEHPDPQAFDQTYHAVPADKRFREWSRAHLKPGTTAQIVQSVMPEACGPDLTGIASNTDRTIDSKIWQKALKQGLKTLGGLAQHGFVHGDIKAQNLCMDRKTGQLQLIDADGMLKRSKLSLPQSVTEALAGTPAYSLPLRDPDEGVGADQDVFGLGLSILYSSLTQRGKSAVAESLLDKVESYNKGPLRFQTDRHATAAVRAALERGLNELLNEVDDRGRRVVNLTSAETAAYALVKKALAQAAPVTGRWVPGQNQHPFADLYSSAA